jgi:hypothetical protein
VLNLPEFFEPPIYIGGFFIAWGGALAGGYVYPRGPAGFPDR